MRQAILVCGLGFGDEGKGSVVDYLVRQTGARLVVRYNGGAQAAHHVVGTVFPLYSHRHEHCFAQFGAGTFAQAHTYLSRFVMVDPLALANEHAALRLFVDVEHELRVLVDVRAPVLTPWHRALNRLRELVRGGGRHGSCGMGIGELGADLAEGLPVLRVGDLLRTDYADVVERAELVRATKRMEAQGLWPHVKVTEASARLWLMLRTPATDWLRDARRAMGEARARYVEGLANAAMAAGVPVDGAVVFEGAQGVLLDEWHGFHPHTTWSTCTFGNVAALLYESNYRAAHVVKVGVLRAYHTRHGAGPFPTEIRDDGWHALARGEHNGSGEWQGAMRYGHFDAVLARYALDVVGGVDALALTCLDRVREDPFRYCGAYSHEVHSRVMVASRDRDLKRQQQIGRWLSLVRPVYRTAPGAVDGVAAALGVPVALRSYGPAAEDKTAVDAPWEAVRA